MFNFGHNFGHRHVIIVSLDRHQCNFLDPEHNDSCFYWLIIMALVTMLLEWFRNMVMQTIVEVIGAQRKHVLSQMNYDDYA